MKFKHKLTALVLCLLTIAGLATTIFAPTLSGRAYADDQNYAYWRDNYKTLIYNSEAYTCTGINCNTGADSHKCTEQILLDQSGKSAKSGQYFDKRAGSDGTCANPATGFFLQVDTKPNNALANADLVSKISVDYGKTDKTRGFTAGDILAKIQCIDEGDHTSYVNCTIALTGGGTSGDSLVGANGSGGDGVAATPDGTILDKNPILYTATFPGHFLQSGQTYQVCFSGKVLAATNASATVCTDKTIYKSSGSTLSKKAKGDSTALGLAASAETKPQTCEDSGFFMSWIICGIIDLAASASDNMFSLVTKVLTTQPLIADKSNKEFQAWSNFRIYGNVFLVIALLVIVFGESIGGGLIDAYTAKKILPRLLISGILINVSFYLVAVASDVTNIVGLGMKDLITAPFTNTNDFGIHVGDGSGLELLIGSTASAWAVGGAVAGTLLSSQFLAVLGLFVVLPALLIAIAIIVTVFLRQALIIFLVVVSPVAFALYCLPNTEKYFQRWWKTLFEALLVFPIIAVLFALADVMGVLMATVAPGVVGELLSVVAFLAPLFMIPFAFKLAGGILGRALELANTSGNRMTEGIKGNANDPNSLRNRVKTGLGSRWTNERERHVNKFNDNANQPFGVRAIRRRKAGLLNYGNLQARRAFYNKQEADRIDLQNNYGDDSNVRDNFIEWDAQADGGKGAWFRRMEMLKDEDGNTRALAGATAVYSGTGAYEKGKAAKRKAQSLNGNDKSRLQKSLHYEWKKTGFDSTQMDNLLSQYDDILSDNGLNAKEGVEMGKAVGFGHQGQSLAGKTSSFGQRKDGSWGMKVNHTSFLKEGATNLASHQWSGQDVASIQEIEAGYRHAVTILTSPQYAGASDDTVISGLNDSTDSLGQYNGQTIGMIRQNAWRAGAMAEELDTAQTAVAAGAVQAGASGAHQTSDQGLAYGLTSAPVEVKAQAKILAQRVRDIDRDAGPGWSRPLRPVREDRSTS